MSAQFTKAVRDHCVIVDGYCESLWALSQSFYDTGNTVMADKLSTMANGLNDSQRVLKRAHTDEQDRQLKEAQAHSAETLKFALAYGAKEAKKDD